MGMYAGGGRLFPEMGMYGSRYGTQLGGYGTRFGQAGVGMYQPQQLGGFARLQTEFATGRPAIQGTGGAGAGAAGGPLDFHRIDSPQFKPGATG